MKVVVGEDAFIAPTVASRLTAGGHRAVVVQPATSPDDELAAARRTGVTHLVALSAVGTGRLLASSYFRAKTMREKLIVDSGIPYSIVRGTQCYESVGRIADAALCSSTFACWLTRNLFALAR